MGQVSWDGEADLVLTSPPYFAADTAAVLRKPLARQLAYEAVRQELLAFAQTLALAFREVRRVLRKGGALVLQTKDLRYGGFLIPLADAHRRLCEDAGLRLAGRVLWQSQLQGHSRRPPAPGARAQSCWLSGFLGSKPSLSQLSAVCSPPTAWTMSKKSQSSFIALLALPRQR